MKNARKEANKQRKWDNRASVSQLFDRVLFQVFSISYTDGSGDKCDNLIY